MPLEQEDTKTSGPVFFVLTSDLSSLQYIVAALLNCHFLARETRPERKTSS